MDELSGLSVAYPIAGRGSGLRPDPYSRRASLCQCRSPSRAPHTRLSGPTRLGRQHVSLSCWRSSRWTAATRPATRCRNGLSSTALSSHRHHPCSWPSSRSGRRVSSSAKAGVRCGRTASLRATSGRLEHVRDVNRAHGACGWLYPPIARSVSCDRGPPSASSDSSVGSRRAAEGPHATPSSDGCAAPPLPPARESTPVMHCPRPLRGLRWKALRKP